MTVNTYAISIEFIGTRYRGWQRQQEVDSIQQHVEAALSKIANEPIEVIAAGRTDAGVHASNMIAHFQTTATRQPYNWLRAANSLLPDDIAVRWIQVMPAEFHARFSAIARRYRYITLNHPFRPAILNQQITHEYAPLNVQLMQQAATYLEGTHDFTSFRAASCQSNQPVRHVHFAKLIQHGELLVLDIQADGFLHHMVRNIMGTLFEIGRGEQPVAWIEALLRSKNRSLAAATASADGLYFINALYPPQFQSLLPATRLSPIWLNLPE